MAVVPSGPRDVWGRGGWSAAGGPVTDQAHSQPASNLSGVGAVVLAYGAGSSAGSVAEGLKGAGLQPQRLVVVVNPDGSGIGPRLPGWAARLDCGSNLGYAAAMNAGIAKLKGTAAEWILVATHDISVSSACLDGLVVALKSDQTLGAVGPRLLDEVSGATYSSGGLIAESGRTGHDKRPFLRGVQLCRWLDGTCILFRRRALEEAGGFRENLPRYFEDVEVGLRLGSSGWGVACVRTWPHRRALADRSESRHLSTSFREMALRSPASRVAPGR